MARQAALIRIGLLRPQDVIPHILDWMQKPFHNAKRERQEFLGQFVHLDSTRLQCFAVKGLTCCSCGIVGQYFAVEIFPGNGPHINLYAVDIDGDEIIMTRDHIHPRSKGGRDNISNCQTMCGICNWKKGSKTEAQHDQEIAQELVP